MNHEAFMKANSPDRAQILKLSKLSIELPEKIPYLNMLVLFGSRARGDTHAKSDWDFAALYDREIRHRRIEENAWRWFEVPQLLSETFGINAEMIDIVDLNKCSSLMAHLVARDGILLYEKEPGKIDNFRSIALKSDAEHKAIRKTLQEKVEKNLQRWGV